MIRGNDVLVKCDIPSFVTDFVTVAEWVDNEGDIYSVHTNQGKGFKATDSQTVTIKERVDTDSQIKSDTEFQRADKNRGRQLFFA